MSAPVLERLNYDLHASRRYGKRTKSMSAPVLERLNYDVGGGGMTLYKIHECPLLYWSGSITTLVPRSGNEPLPGYVRSCIGAAQLRPLRSSALLLELQLLMSAPVLERLNYDSRTFGDAALVDKMSAPVLERLNYD